MYKPIYNKATEKGRTLLLLQKRNQQFAALFKRLKDPVNILQFYLSIGEVYKKYFGDEEKASVWVKVLMYVYDKGFFWQSDLAEKMNLTPIQADSVLKKMGKRHLLKVDKSRKLYLYNLSPDGHIFLQNFTKDCTTAMMKVIKESRSGKKKVFTTIKKKKK